MWKPITDRVRKMAGIWLDESFICDADTDSPYVWVDDGKGKLEKRSDDSWDSMMMNFSSMRLQMD